MASYGDLKAQIASDLRRSNLPTEIAQAVLDAIRDYDIERFYFNETAVYTLTTVPGQDEYPITAQSPILEFIKIDNLRAQAGNVWYDVTRETMDDIERLYSAPSNGQPFRFAVHGNDVRFYPMPDKAYPIRIFGHYRLIELGNNIDSNDWTNAGKNLIRYSTLKRLYFYPIRDLQQAQAAEAAEMRELEYLRRETDRRARSGRMQAYYG
jgi:hypothetical protein